MRPRVASSHPDPPGNTGFLKGLQAATPGSVRETRIGSLNVSREGPPDSGTVRGATPWRCGHSDAAPAHPLPPGSRQHSWSATGFPELLQGRGCVPKPGSRRTGTPQSPVVTSLVPYSSVLPGSRRELVKVFTARLSGSRATPCSVTLSLPPVLQGQPKAGTAQARPPGRGTLLPVLAQSQCLGPGAAGPGSPAQLNPKLEQPALKRPLIPHQHVCPGGL